MGMQQWSAKGTARVVGGTLKQLVDKLVYYRTIGNGQEGILHYYVYMPFWD